MNNLSKIRLLGQQDIDYEKWGQTIENARNKRLYARSWYLDLVVERWSALIFGDYEYVMPLPLKKKYRITYVYQPEYIQQLGIFPTPPFEIQEAFAHRLRNQFRLVSYQLNNENSIDAFKNFKATEKVNFCVNLQPPYKTLFSKFSQHAKRNIRTAENNKVKIIKGQLPYEYMVAKKSSIRTKVEESTYKKLTLLMSNTITSGKGVVYAAYSSVNNLCGAAFFLLDGGRAFYLNAFSTDEGRKNRAMYAVVNEFIKEHSETDLVLDFEGSIIGGIARFYKGFGALPENYFYIYSNRLPVIKIFMK
ncbi:hypothetical protein MNBD_BACTEROID01-1507 [hydrothermal vent metagenome]|uniref:BioF2-like acetyltransferase domain-containing protein n=1 Tax=hydrothermal vent metagenome TaxID=652676 RepID=A0A3B0TLX0_9ZZZZ